MERSSILVADSAMETLLFTVFDTRAVSHLLLVLTSESSRSSGEGGD